VPEIYMKNGAQMESLYRGKTENLIILYMWEKPTISLLF